MVSGSCALRTGPGPRALLHLVAAVHFWYGCYYDWYHVNVPIEVSRMGADFGKSGKLKFLTYWDAVGKICLFVWLFFFIFVLQLLQAVFFTICLVDDLFGTSEAVPKTRPLTRRLRDTVSHVNWPEMFCFSLFVYCECLFCVVETTVICFYFVCILTTTVHCLSVFEKMILHAHQYIIVSFFCLWVVFPYLFF